MVTVWGRRSSSNVQAVMWCIEELGIPYQRIDAGFTYGVTDTDEYLLMNPNGTVPTIKDDDNKPLWESGAILRYLAGRYTDDQFWPCDHAFADYYKRISNRRAFEQHVALPYDELIDTK